jgi:hypothetical protein
MDDREVALREIAEDLRERESVADAWLAKSFTDRLFVVELTDDESLPSAIENELVEAGLRPYNDLHDVPAMDAAFAGDLDGAKRYRFVDVQSRGSLQSYVVE